VSYLNPIAATHTILKGPETRTLKSEICNPKSKTRNLKNLNPETLQVSYLNPIAAAYTIMKGPETRNLKPEITRNLEKSESRNASGELLESDRRGLHHIEGARGTAPRHPQSHPGKSTFGFAIGAVSYEKRFNR